MVRVSDMLNVLRDNKVDFKFYGDENHVISAPYTNDNEHIIESFNYSMADLDSDTEYGLIISKFEIKNNSKCQLVTENAKFIFYHFASVFFYKPHSQEYLDDYKIDLSIGRNNSIFKNVVLGNNITIFESNSIGRPGYTYYDFNGITERLKPFGNVILEDNVEISSFVNIDRGNIGSTILKRGANIDSLVHIAHDVEIGSNSKIIAGSIIGGYTRIGDNSFVGMNVTIKNSISLGDKVIVGMGSNVTKSFGNNLILAGNPAKIFGINCDCGKRQMLKEKEYQCKCGLHYSIESNTNVVKTKNISK